MTFVLAFSLIAIFSVIMRVQPQQTPKLELNPEATPSATPVATHTSSENLTEPHTLLASVTAAPTTAAHVTAKNTTVPTEEIMPVFKVSVCYAYVGPKENKNAYNDFEDPMVPVSYYPFMIYLNMTRLPNRAFASADGVSEQYQIQLRSDTGAVQNCGYFKGTNINPDFKDPLPLTGHRLASLDEHPIVVFTGEIRFDIEPNQSVRGGPISDLGSYSSRETGSGLWAFGTPTAVTLTIYRMGWTIAGGNFGSYQENPDKLEKIVELKLTPFKDGFVCNNYFSESQLAKMDLFSVPSW
ncbi:MAG: hypothetical protein NWF00_10385 [Candidatus Bathyarchaeota archaeon]|nr:hypothetical protein [Candidatus Bathyarchaeota archaeon]